jgi:choline kinase
MNLEESELIILAAGDSSRLIPVTANIPKCLLKVGDKALLMHLIDAFEIHGVVSCSIVVGYKYERIRESVSGDNIRLILNPHYDTTGSLYSLWLSKREYDKGVIIANSDVYLVPELVEKVVSSPSSAALVNNSAEWDTESTKVLVSGGRITRWSRELTQQEWSGENVGVVKIRGDSVSRFYQIVEDLMEQGKDASWWPEALNQFTKKNIVTPLYSNGLLCKEVDTPEDYEALISLVKRENKV